MRLTADRLNTTEWLTETSVSLPVVLWWISQNYLDHKHAREDADGLKDERDQVAGVSEEEPDTQSKEWTKEVAWTTSQKTEKPTASKEKKDEAKEWENGVLDDKVGMGEKNW
jgi:hypothetical protein